MKKCILLILLLYFYGVLKANSSNKDYIKEIRAKEWIKNKPLEFIENKGQFTNTDGKPAHDVLFKTSFGNCDIYITTKGLSYVFVKFEKDSLLAKNDEFKFINKNSKTSYYRLDMNLEGANINKTNIIKEEESREGDKNYYYAHCSNGIYNVKGYGKVTIKNIYPGIDWVLYTNLKSKGHPLKYDFVIHSGSDYKAIKIKFLNAQIISLLDDKTKLKIETIAGNIEEGKLFSYLNNENEQQEIKSKYLLNNDSLIAFEIEDYDKTKTLIIDPLVWATYYGGSSIDYFNSICTDSLNNIYLTGCTYSVNFPTQQFSGAYWQNILEGSYDIFILKFNSQGVRQWATYYGGTDIDVGKSICIDSQENIYVTGYSGSSNIPTQQMTGAYWQAVCAGNVDLFILKFNNQGIRQWATFYGGSAEEGGSFICIDHLDNIFITGYTKSIDFPTLQLTGAYWQPNNAGSVNGVDIYILKFNNQGVRQWATYYGGNARDINNNSSEWGNLICVDSQNNIYIAGTTSSTNFPLQQLNGAYWQGSFAGGSDAFILKFNNQGVRQWATYYGGGGIEDACAICVDHQDNICITGSTVSNNFPTQQLPGAYWQSSLSDSFYYDIFIIKFNDQGARQWATYYGGTIDDHGYSIFADNIDNIYVIGNTTSTDFPIQQLGGEYFQAVCSNIGGNTSDAFILEFNKHGVRQYATYYGSNGSDMGKGIAVDSQNSIYFIGTLGDSTAFTVDPGNGAYYENSWHSGDIWWDGFILKIKCNITNPTSIKSDRNYLCSLDNGTITLMAIGGSGDSLKWYTGGCGQTYIGSGINITIPTPTQTTTYYACWESECGTSACVNIVIYVYDVFYTYLNPIICQNESFSVGIHNYSLIGIYNDTLQTLAGCDSIITTNLFVNPIPPPPIISQTYNLLNSNASAGNQWYNQDGIMVGDTNQNLNLIVNGDYYVIVILNGCVSDTSNVLHITNVGVSENESNSNINIYPNPVSMELIIEAKGNKEKIEFEILNAIGQVVYKGSLLGEIIVQTKGFAQGMYMVKLGNGKRFEFRKVLKN